MAKTQKWVVRVVLTDKQESALGAFIECMRYAGHAGSINYTDNASWFDIPCPAGLDSQRWSAMNAERMRTFGFNAVSAPAQ